MLPRHFPQNPQVAQAVHIALGRRKVDLERVAQHRNTDDRLGEEEIQRVEQACRCPFRLDALPVTLAQVLEPSGAGAALSAGINTCRHKWE